MVYSQRTLGESFSCKEECKGCGRCVLGCSQNVIKIGSELNKAGYRYAYYSGEGCSGCRDCFLTCPEPLALEVYVYTKKEEDND